MHLLLQQPKLHLPILRHIPQTISIRRHLSNPKILMLKSLQIPSLFLMMAMLLQLLQLQRLKQSKKSLKLYREKRKGGSSRQISFDAAGCVKK